MTMSKSEAPFSIVISTQRRRPSHSLLNNVDLKPPPNSTAGLVEQQIQSLSSVVFFVEQSCYSLTCCSNHSLSISLGISYTSLASSKIFGRYFSYKHWYLYIRFAITLSYYECIHGCNTEWRRFALLSHIRGAVNRKVAATNMNLASNRSHSVFTCVIESKVHELLKLINELLPSSARRNEDVPSSARRNEDVQLVLEKKKILMDQPELLRQFGINILPILIEVVNSGANLYVCYGCLSIINKFVISADLTCFLTWLRIPTFLGEVYPLVPIRVDKFGI
ncbi:hypothetical protein NE237_005985 [Protea cynaroides]|uniref:Uncharacterized protein n=1 Tax=Protea cynaroides TaxID=273540 RepID=A0A9Q0KM94_9MAGN|nr:hypothetical protein NE237_005985 [Protea cynaroides]